jgi:hypothetical protein
MNSILRSIPLLSVALLGLSLGGCKKPEYPACKKDKHCKVDLGEACVDGTCQNCKVDADCADKGAGLVCHEFRCQDPSQIEGGAGGGSELGGPCTQRDDCVGGFACTAGVCSTCTDDLDCAPSTCNLDSGRCDPGGQCTTDDQCPMDEICDGGMCIFSGNFGEPGAGPCEVNAVFFAFDSDKLTPKSEEALGGLATCIAEHGGQVYLEAHADNVGTEEYNILLTERRGSSVKDFLVAKGVAVDLLQVIAKGNLEATGSTESERSQDRRVQFIWP